MFRPGWVLLLSTWTSLSAAVLVNVCPYKECRCYVDEIDCQDLNLTSLPKLVVSQVSGKQYLSLNNNFITNITKEGLPSGLGGIDLEGNPITFVAEDAFDGSEDTLVDITFSGANLDELPFALFSLGSLKHLSVLNSQVRQWDDSILYFLSNSLLTLTLVDAGLTEWPPWISSMSSITDLEFSSMPVTVPDDAFHGISQDLKSVTLRNVSLTSTRNHFSNLPNLTTLVLENNQISEITGLPNFGILDALNLNNNSITDRTNLSVALSPVAKSLTIILFNLNKLTTLPDLTFLTNLESADLGHNKIYITKSGAFPANLLAVYLNNNKIASTSNFLRTGLKLENIYLASNFITQIQGADFPPSVLLIDFTSNLISELRDNSFPVSTSITTLTLDFNPISQISSSAFNNLKQLKHLSLKECKLTRLPTPIGLLDSLQVLDMSGSASLVCTCAESSLRRWAMSVSPTISGDCGVASIDYFLRTLSADCLD